MNHDFRAYAAHALREHNDKELADWLEAGAPGALPYNRDRTIATIRTLQQGYAPGQRLDGYDGKNEWNLRGALLGSLLLATTSRLTSGAPGGDSPAGREHADASWRETLKRGTKP